MKRKIMVTIEGRVFEEDCVGSSGHSSERAFSILSHGYMVTGDTPAHQIFYPPHRIDLVEIGPVDIEE